MLLLVNQQVLEVIALELRLIAPRGVESTDDEESQLNSADARHRLVRSRGRPLVWLF